MIGGREQTVGAGLVIERDHLLPLAEEGVDLAQISFPTVNGLGCVKVLTNTYSVPLPAGTRCKPKLTPASSRCGMKAVVSRGTNVVIDANNRSSISSIIWMFCPANQAHSPDRSRWNRGDKPACGRRASTGSGKP